VVVTKTLTKVQTLNLGRLEEYVMDPEKVQRYMTSLW
jgi:hypothetical protein